MASFYGAELTTEEIKGFLDDFLSMETAKKTYITIVPKRLASSTKFIITLLPDDLAVDFFDVSFREGLMNKWTGKFTKT
jgi:hypothetical protein